jgi:nucleotide-binding universal stress UspA family protein
MYRSIMVPLDGSPFGEHALPIALSLARRSDATLHLVRVHTMVLPLFVDGMPAIDSTTDTQIREGEQAYLDGAAQRLAAYWDGAITVKLLDGVGSIADTLHDYVTSAGIDLVVMATHGRGGITRAWLGSVADALVRQVIVPLLVVRPHEAAAQLDSSPVFQRILIPLDGSALSEEILERALGLGTLMQAEYTLLRVVEPFTFPGYSPIAQMQDLATQATQEACVSAQTYLDEVARRLRAAGAEVQIHTRVAELPAAAILDEARQHRADLIAMATHGRAGLARLLLGSVTDKVLRGTETPVLLYRPRGH